MVGLLHCGIVGRRCKLTCKRILANSAIAVLCKPPTAVLACAAIVWSDTARRPGGLMYRDAAPRSNVLLSYLILSI